MRRTNNYNSEIKFAFVFTFLFLILGSYLYFSKESQLGFVFYAFSLILFILIFVKPSALTFYTNAWIKLGNIFGRFFSPIILGIIYFSIFAPVAIVTRVFGRDELNLKNTDKTSYWLPRNNQKINSDSFKNQF